LCSSPAKVQEWFPGPSLFKVERYEFDFVLVEDAKQARDFEIGDSDPTKTVTEITEMSPEQEGFK